MSELKFKELQNILNNDHAYECPICIKNIGKDEEIIGFPCNEKYLYFLLYQKSILFLGIIFIIFAQENGIWCSEHVPYAINISKYLKTFSISQIYKVL